MATIDSNGVLFYQDSDNFTPPASLNLAQSNLSDLLASGVRFKRVANDTAKAALVASIGLANITAANPLFVWRADAPNGKQLEVTTDGSTWGHYEVASNTYYYLIAGDPAYDVRMWYKNGVVTVFAQGTAPLAPWVNWAIATLPAGYWPALTDRIGTLNPSGNFHTGAISVNPNNGVIGIHNRSADTIPAWTATVTYVI